MHSLVYLTARDDRTREEIEGKNRRDNNIRERVEDVADTGEVKVKVKTFAKVGVTSRLRYDTRYPLDQGLYSGICMSPAVKEPFL